MTKDQLTRLAKAENFAEEHMHRTGTVTRARPVIVDGSMHIVYDIMNSDGLLFSIGAVEAFTYTQDEYDGYARRQKGMFPNGFVPGRKR